MRLNFAVLSLVGLLALSGCVSYKPEPLDGRAELLRLSEATVEKALATPESPPGSMPLGPFDLSDGLSEDELVAVTLTLNPELQAARKAIGEANALLVQAGILPNPEVGVGYRAGISGTPGFSLDTDLLFSLLRVGERSQGKRVAEAAALEATATVAAREYEIAATTRLRLSRVLVAEQLLSLLEGELALREKAAALVERQRDLGEANELDVSAASLEAAELRRDRRQAELAVQTARGELNRLLGLPPVYELHLSESGKPFEVRAPADPSDSELEERLLAQRLDLRAKEAEYGRVEAELRLAVLRQYPKLRIGPSFSHEGESDNYLGIGASLELPIFDRNQGEIAQKQAQRDKVREEYKALLHRLLSDAHLARLRLRAASAEVASQRSQILPLLTRSEELFRGAFEARELKVLEFVATQNRALRTRRVYLESLAAERDALIELDSALGFATTRSTALPSPTPTEPSSIRSTP
jgi:outer membrane protein TolC